MEFSDYASAENHHCLTNQTIMSRLNSNNHHSHTKSHPDNQVLNNSDYSTHYNLNNFYKNNNNNTNNNSAIMRGYSPPLGVPLSAVTRGKVASKPITNDASRHSHHISNIISPTANLNGTGNKFPENTSNHSDITMPNDEELDSMFAKVLATMDLPPDKSKVLWGYDRDKKWELIRDQRKVQAKQEPQYYLSKLKSYMSNPNGKLHQQVTSRFQVSKKRKNRQIDGSNRISNLTQLLRDLEISLRTNSIDWVREFLSEKNNGLDVLIDYLTFRSTAIRNEHATINQLSSETSVLSKSIGFDLTNHLNKLHNQFISVNSEQTAKPIVNNLLSGNEQACKKPNPSTISTDDIHVCIMCLRSIMNNKKGFNMVMEHPQAINCLALSLNHTSVRTKTLVLELLAAICLVKGGHELIMSAFENFKTICNERRRFETLIYYLKNQEKFDVDFMVSCLQFINIIVHSQDDMNYRTHLQYEFTNLALDDYLEKLKQNESEELHLQIQTYLDNRIDVNALAEEAEVKNSALEQVQQLIEKLSISHELQTQLQLNYQAVDCKFQEEAQKNVELLKTNENLQRQLAQLTEQKAAQPVQVFVKTQEAAREPILNNYSSRRNEHLDESMQRQSSPSRFVTDISGPNDQSTTTRILIGPMNSGAKAPAPIPPPPPPPPPPTLPLSTIPTQNVAQEKYNPSATPAPPPPPPPPPPTAAACHKKGMAPQPPNGQPKPLQNSNKSNDSSNNANNNCDMMTLKQTFSTQYKLPTFNWSTLKPNQVRGTIFNEFHEEEKIIKSIDFKAFEEQFKLGNRSNKTPGRDNPNDRLRGDPELSIPNSQSASSNLSCSPSGSNPSSLTKRYKQPEKISFMEHNRLRNMAISLRKLATPTDLLVSAINRLDTEQLSLDSIEILMRMSLTPQEVQEYRDYESQGRPLDALTDEDRFLCQMSKIDRLEQKVRTMFYIKNLDANGASQISGGGNSLNSAHSISSSNTDSADLLASTRVKIESVERAAKSLRTSEGIRILLEHILVFGNYLNSSSRSLASAPAYGFKLQALDMVVEARSTQDKTRNLLHFIVETMMKNLSSKERTKLTSATQVPNNNTNNSNDLNNQQASKTPTTRSTNSANPTNRRLNLYGGGIPLEGDSLKIPYDFDMLIIELEQAANVSLETLMIEVKEFERGMELCIKELHLRCAAAEALEQQRQQQQQDSGSPDKEQYHGRPTSPTSVSNANSIKNPTDETICRLQRFIKSKSGEIVEIRELIQRAQKEFNECAQYFGENPRTIESSSLFSIFLRHLKNFRQCLVDNKMAEKRKFDEELRKQIQQQQALRFRKRRSDDDSPQQHNNNDDSINNNNNNNSKLRGSVSRGDNAMQQDPAGDSNRLLHQDEVSHGTLDILITGLKVEPYRRIDGSRKSVRRLGRQSGNN